MDLQTIFDYILKWFIPFACAGLFGLLIKPVIKDLTRGRDLRLKEEWNERAKEMTDIVKICQEENVRLSKELVNGRQEWLTEKIAQEQELQQVKQDLLDEIKQNTSGVREALLTMHLYNLICDSKRYIEYGWISVEDWQDFSTRYDTYIKLGGNGHMDPWYPKVKALPNHPPKN